MIIGSVESSSIAIVIDGTSLAPTGVTWPLDDVSTVAVSPDGAEAVTVSRSGRAERHQLATGELPFGEPVTKGGLRQRLWMDPVPPRRHRADVPEWLQEIILKCLQTGFLVSFDSISPKLEKLNPIEGFKKFVSLKQYVELLKSLIKMAVVISILAGVIREDFGTVLLSQELSLWQIMTFTGELVMKVVTRVGMFYLVVAFFDYFYQRFEYMKSMKMSKKEIKDEYKRLEGDPTIKQRQREAARQMSQGRQMGAVPNADVVVTNPIHLAIALEYKPDQMNAPRVLAKGKRLVAQQIREMAERHNIPIVENPPLAQALYPIVEPDMEVPPQFYKAVAEILAFVYNLRKKRSRRY